MIIKRQIERQERLPKVGMIWPGHAVKLFPNDEDDDNIYIVTNDGEPDGNGYRRHVTLVNLSTGEMQVVHGSTRCFQLVSEVRVRRRGGGAI